MVWTRENETPRGRTRCASVRAPWSPVSQASVTETFSLLPDRSTLLGTGRWEEDAPLPSCLFGSVPFFLTSPKATCSVEETDFPREQDYCQSVCTRVWVPLTSLLFSSLPTRSSTLDFFFSQHTPSSMTDLTIIHVFSHAAFDSALCGFSQNVAASQERTINLLFIH